MPAAKQILLGLSMSMAVLATAGSPAPLTSTAAVKSLPGSAYLSHTAFRFSGKVLSIYGSHFALEDADGRIGINHSRLEPPGRIHAGDVVDLSGHCDFEPISNKKLLYATNVVLTGKAPPLEPIDLDARDFNRHEIDFLPVRLSGTVTGSFTDEIDPKCQFLMLRSHGKHIPMSFPLTNDSVRTALEGLVNAEIRLTGICNPDIGSWRIFHGRGLSAVSDVKILKPAPKDPFLAPELKIGHPAEPDDIADMGRCAVAGTVIAVWHGDRFLVATGKEIRTTVQAVLPQGSVLPTCGDFVRVVGYPETDLFHIILNNAIWRKEDGFGQPVHEPENINANKLLFDELGRPQLQAPYHGHVIRIRGIVRSLPATDNVEGKIHVENEGHDVPIDVSAAPKVLDGLAIGCEIEATGVCLMDTDAWRSNAPFPRVRGFVIVVRTPSDIRILSRPPWWTPGRLMVVIGSLLAALIVFVIWNRALNRIIVRRSRQLLREELAHHGAELRIDERTRLAVELHDSLSQNLSGLACQITAVKKALPEDAAAAAGKLDIAERMLFSSRTELKRCLWDLRGNTLECRDMAEAVRQTVQPAVGEAALSVRFDVARANLTDSTAHSILCIARELASNAVRHGQATRIRIAGTVDGPNLVFSVRDNGTGFDIAHHASIAEGHFGLEGIRERVERLNGEFRIESSSETGTSARISIPMDVAA